MVYRLSRPFGTFSLSELDPNVETLGYYRLSLRDKVVRGDRRVLQV